MRLEEEKPVYDASYPQSRSHHDALVGACKRRTLERWLKTLGIRVAGLTVCEIGFGGGWCLAGLQNAGADVMGIEPVAVNRSHAAQLGVAQERLFDSEPLPLLSLPVDLWLLQDSFEHIEMPESLVRWMARHSNPQSKVLVVAPDASSLSRRLMGRFWIHNSADHRVHYTPAGVGAVMEQGSFRFARGFRPTKCVSLATVWAHVRILAGLKSAQPSALLPDWNCWFNIGQMGLVFERDAN